MDVMTHRGRPAARFATALLLLLLAAAPAGAGILEGTIYDSTSLQPIPRVTIRIEGSGQAMLGNEDGRYRLSLEPGVYRIRFSHVAHYSTTIDVEVADTLLTRDVYLHPSVIEIPGTRVYSRQYDPAQEIIVEAIRRKQELLDKIRDYRFAGYTKLLVRKLRPDKPDEFWFIAETQLEGWFQQPDRYKEIISARRQSANLPAESNLMTIGEIFNFNANRIELGRQAVVSPTATDALDFYNYYLLDTVLVEGMPAFQLEVEPKGSTHPLFAGEILIADSTYAVVGVDLGLNEAFDAPYLSKLRFSQRYARFENDTWMPVDIRFGGEADLPIPGFPLLSFSYTAVLNSLRINEGIPDDRFDQYAIEVAPEADEVDSAAWDQALPLPLTVEELDGYRHIDSLENRPFSIKRALPYIPLGLLMIGQSPQLYPFAHFNKVDGPYLGLGRTFEEIIPRSELHLRSGWAFDLENWQHRYHLRTLLEESRQLAAEVEYHDEVRSRALLFTSGEINPTWASLLYKINPLDYYLEKGFAVRVGFRPIPHTHLELAYRDFNQYALANQTNYGFFNITEDSIGFLGVRRDHRPNPAIINGHLRSLSVNLRYDSRRLIKNKGIEIPLSETPFTLVTAQLEQANPELIKNDFDFRRYELNLWHYQPLPGWGETSLRLIVGGSDRALPPQRYFVADQGDPDNVLMLQFKTLGEINFTGDRVAAIYLGQDFGTTFFRKLHIPLLNRSPFSLLLFGGAFWSDFDQASWKVPGEPLHAAPDWYSEIGFGLGRLPPILMRLYFTWQLSTYETEQFNVKFGLGF